MRTLPALVALCALAACNREPAPSSAAPPGPSPSASPSPTPPASPAPSTSPSPSTNPNPGAGCQRQPFEKSVDVAEASGAVFVAAAGDAPAHLLVVGDSGTHGAFAVLDAATGTSLGSGQLPLEKGQSDDLEGLAWLGDELVALTSNGRLRHFRRTGLASFDLAVPAYPIAPVGKTDDLTCASATATNCGRNWEGLCLHATPPADAAACAGFAASKRDGELVCLTRTDQGRLRADPARTIKVSRPESLTGCDLVGDTLYAGTNLFDGARVYRVTGLADPATAQVSSLGPLGSGFPEAIAAAPGGELYRFSDLANRPSLMDRFVCR